MGIKTKAAGAEPVVIVEWIDANCEHEELRVDEMSPLVTFFSAGWLVAEEEDYVSVALDRCDYDGTRRYRDTTHIPRVCIKRVIRLQGID